MKRENIALALFSGLLVGSGQILKGEVEKGLKLMLTFYFGLPLLLYLTLSFSGGLFLLVFGIVVIFCIIFWAYNIWDAAR